MHTPHPTPLDPPLAISYRNHQNSLVYFSHLAPLILFLFTKKQSQKGGGGHGTMPPSLKYAPAVKSKKKATRPQMFYKNKRSSA